MLAAIDVISFTKQSLCTTDNTKCSLQHLTDAVPHPLQVLLPKGNLAVAAAHSENIASQTPRDPPDNVGEFPVATCGVGI